MSTNNAPRAADDHPVTYLQAAVMPVAEALMRHQLLDRRDRLSKTAAHVGPQGRRRHGGTPSEPLTVRELLELLALGEHLARHFRDPLRVHHAVRAGATWPQIAAARAETSFHARQNYIQWADEQRAWALAEADPGVTTGMSAAEHIAARVIACMPACPHCGSHRIVWAGNDDTFESWHCSACHRDYITGGRA
jgi:hypothetical protein